MLQAVSIDGYFDPGRDFLEATAGLRFSRPADDLCIWLARELQLDSVQGGGPPSGGIQRDSDQFQVHSLGTDELALRYSGKLALGNDSFAASWKRGTGGEAPLRDDCKLLSYVSDFYPHGRLDFISMKVSLRVPGGWNCLGSGVLSSARTEADSRSFTFESPMIKGMSLVFGRFEQVGRVPGMIPVRLFGWPEFSYQKYYGDPAIARLLAFYWERFGPLDVPELNVLFRRGSNFSGISTSGLVVLNLDEAWGRYSEKTRKALLDESPLSMLDATTDLLAHELAHQWWGGLVSWDSPADNWLTEGLATYSTLLYLRKFKGEKAFRKACAKLRQRVKPCAKQGVPADGIKLKLLNSDIRAFQTLVYAKPALMLVELADAIGEDEVVRRLRSILVDCRYRNLGTAEFLGLLANGDERTGARIREWILATGLPGV